MAITTYAQLQTAVDNWTKRTDLTSTELISLFEARFKRKIKHWRAEKRATITLTVSDQYVTLPSDFIEMRNLWISSTNPVVHLNQLTPINLFSLYAGSTTGKPKTFALIGGEIALGPIPDSAYTIQMIYSAFSVLSDSNTTNWLLTHHPDVYLFGSLMQAEAYLGADERIPLWKSLLDEALGELDREDRKARSSGAMIMTSDVTKT